MQSNYMDDEPDCLSNHLLEYDPNTNKWRVLAPMKYSKYRCSAVVLNGEIFVMGKFFFRTNISMHISSVNSAVTVLLNEFNPTDMCNFSVTVMILMQFCRRYWM